MTGYTCLQNRYCVPSGSTLCGSVVCAPQKVCLAGFLCCNPGATLCESSMMTLLSRHIPDCRLHAMNLVAHNGG